MATLYAVYCVKIRVGWLGVILSISLSFLSNDALNLMLQWCDSMRESTHSEEQKQSETVIEDEFSGECEFSTPAEEFENQHSCCNKAPSKPPASSVVKDTPEEAPPSKLAKEQTSSAEEMKRILSSIDHYEALGFPRHKKIDTILLKKEYRKMVYVSSPSSVISGISYLMETVYLLGLGSICLQLDIESCRTQPFV